MIESTEDVSSSTEEFHSPALLVLQLGGDGGPVGDQPGVQTVVISLRFNSHFFELIPNPY